MSIEDELAEVEAACRDRRTAQDAAAAAVVRRERAIQRLHQQGIPKGQVAALVLDYLREHGFTDDELSGLGVSRSSVRLALDRPRHTE